MFNDIDANYSPHFVKLARTTRDKIRSGRFQRGDAQRSADLVREHGVSARVAGHALAMLAANCYVVAWQARQ
jgi:DNA-binding GntR family transcriptional regulator